MAIGLILAPLRRNKFGAVLIGLQTAVTLAILCNAVFIIQQRLALMERASGADEKNVFVIDNQWIGHPGDAHALFATDMTTLRSLPGVVDAYASNSYPMSNSGMTGVANLTAEQANPTALGAVYFADDHTLNTLGLRLVAGRNFASTQLRGVASLEVPELRVEVVMLTRALAEKVFPRGSAVGRTLYLGPAGQATVIGVVDRLQVPWTSADGWGSAFSASSMLFPLQPFTRNAQYLVRAWPGQLADVMAAAQKALYAQNPSRILSDVRSLADTRREAYRDDRGFAIVLTAVCVVMLAITACGIVGLTSYWVAQRRRQIGIRRALGATRTTVVGHFQAENLLISLAGTSVGAALAMGASLWAVSEFETARLPVAYVIIGAMLLIAFGQLAALWPATRAAWVPPALAARSA